MQSPSSKINNLARCEAVAFRYPQQSRDMKPISLKVKPGELALITGSSGSGKSTLARCLTGLIPHLYKGTLTGKVFLEGIETTQAPIWQLAGMAGLVFQNPSSQMLTASVEEEIIFGLENLGLPPSQIHERLEKTLNHFDLERFRQRDPLTLSGGEQQKLALAATMAREPRLLVLDEPLSMLDPTAAYELVGDIQRIQDEGRSVVVCEHRHEYFQSLTHVLTLPLNGHGHDQRVDNPLPVLHPFGEHFFITLDGLTVQRGNRTILRDIHLRVDGGQIVAIVGRNGVGKTTLLRAMTGLQTYEGSVRLNPKGGSPQLGMVFQNPDLQLFNPTVRDEIRYGLSNPDEELYAWLLAALGLELYESTPPLLLSEGEKKRLVLATVLLHQPQHGILLDEPALGQDKTYKKRLMHLLHAVADSGRVAVITTHDIELAIQADRILLLGPEGFVADGPPSEVLKEESAWHDLGLRVPKWLKDMPSHGARR